MLGGVLSSVSNLFPIVFRQFDPLGSGFSFQQLFYQWETFGVFDVLLPFLLLFAVVFAILTNTRALGDNKGVNLVISLVLALLGIRFAFVTDFFAIIFANLGIAIAGLVVMLIMIGLFVNDQNRKGLTKTVYFISLIAFAIVVIASINQFAWFGSPWWQRNWTSVLWIGILVAIIGAVMGEPDKSNSKDWGPLTPLRDALGGRH